MNNPVKSSLAFSQFPEGYGEFPYIIIKIGYAAFMQIPIQINPATDDVSIYPGTHLRNISEEEIKAYEVNKDAILHHQLVHHAKKIRRKIQEDSNRLVTMCIVEGEKNATYFHKDKIYHSEHIPSGGTLVTQTNSVIGMGTAHFIPNN